MEPLLSIEELTVTFHTPLGKVRAVDGASLTVQKGQIMGLIGETGSGKSVLGLSIPGLLSDTAKITGVIRFMGQDLLLLQKDGLRKLRGTKIAFVPQNPATSLNPVMRIGRQIAEAIKAPYTRKQKRAHAARLLAELNMPEPWEKLQQYPFQLSGGMKQRVLAAIGAAGQPALLIADEPTKGLDAIVRDQVVSLIRQVATQTGAGILIITHDLYVAKSLCDEIGVMYAGEIVESGPADELFAKPKHPYTSGLLQSMPGKGMIPIPGVSPSLMEEYRGCKFQARCSQRLVYCDRVAPELYTVDDRKVRCFLHDSGRASEQNVQDRLAATADV
ncbi:ABC transporter ATP-binding protein [Brevibacillus reuszeri]|uniref:ABC transporter ATP-binding protein n=1 Tax=Brevibacillus reuszeri TaxID=54915 RepID=UPI00289EF7B6|nr:ABC transporter ATP-binding protein [Brevibacillus reuszeri]